MKISKKEIVIAVLSAAVFGVGGFWGGLEYQKSKFLQRSFDRSGFSSNFNQIGESRMRQPGQGFISGEIIQKDEKSLTVKLRDGGSKIIIFPENVEVGKFVTGSIKDLEIGKSVTINGKTNVDGSLTAQSIQIRPQLSPLP